MSLSRSSLLVAVAVAATLPLLTRSAEEARVDSSAPWKIEDQHGAADMVSFTTDEGTWLQLDLSPDGKEVVFGLLGDLYKVPLTGGDATRLTSGAAWDVQPRYSPDGTLITFASDRGGLEGVWVMNPDGSQPRQVAMDSRAALSQPVFSEDGAWLLARKRLTDTSSIGTVELWMVHLLGGKGIQITKKDAQPDAADAVFSRDGRFIYFSARDGRFQYDRNVYEGVWQIKRYDRRTGELTAITSDFGGAAAPRLSPDGTRLSYVRRVRGTTELRVHELATGKARTVASGLTRDLMENFSQHGTFPAYAWTPDGREIVATAEGRIWRFDVLSGARTPVPFRAQVDLRVTQAVRSRQDVSPADVMPKMIRWPVSSPDGKRLVFSALGHLYSMDLPGGTPRRLTSLTDAEYAPAFSPDGKQITFVTWNDLSGGQVWVMPSSGGAPKQVTRVPAHYANPAFSPDGSKIVFVRGSGVTFRDQGLGGELWEELRWIPSRGGEDTLILQTPSRGSARRMTRPTFAADGARIWYLEDEKPSDPHVPPKSLLCSVQLDGQGKRCVLRFEAAEEIAVSPDERHVAYVERFEAWVTALPRTGTLPVDVGAGETSLPVAKLSEAGGEWIQFTGGGKGLSWIFGSSFRRIALDKALKAQEPPPEPRPGEKAPETPLPESELIPIPLKVPRDRPTGVVAYVGGRIVTMKGQEVIEDGVLVVEGNTIKGVGPRAQVSLPAGAKVVDVAGKTLIPGMIDVHAHLHYSSMDILPQQPWSYLANLAYGITTVHDPSASTHEVFSQAEMVEAGQMIGPRVFSTGYILYGADDGAGAIINSLDDARRHVRRLKSQGAISVKSYMQPRRDQRQWVLQAAREEGMLVVPEGGGDLEMDLTMVIDGHTTVEHALPVTPLYNDVVSLFARSRTGYTPTLLVAYGGLSGEKWFYQHYDLWKNERLLRYVPQGVIDPPSRIRTMAADDDWHHINVAAGARKILEAGGLVNLGGHGQLQGLGPHWEVWGFVQGGMSPHQALQVATINGARSLGMDNQLGSLETGKLADFIVLDGNPLEKIERTEEISLVVKNGRAYTPEELARKAPVWDGK